MTTFDKCMEVISTGLLAATGVVVVVYCIAMGCLICRSAFYIIAECLNL